MNQDKGTRTKAPRTSISASLQASRLFIYLIFIVIAVVAFTHFMRPEQRFFVDPPTGSKVEVFPLDEPNVTPSSLVNWATQAATNIHTVDFFNYQANIDALRDYFTYDGYQQFLSAIDSSGTLDKIVDDKLILSAVAINGAVIRWEGELRGVYSWRIQVPLLLTFQGASTRSTQKNIVVEMLVTRVPTDKAPKGIGIAQLVTDDYYEER